jgi:sugar phosphate isomerase/epimerase
MQLAATVCLIPQLAKGPFLYSGELVDGCRRAAEAGFDAVELLIPSPDAVSPDTLGELLATYGLKLSGISTGAAFLLEHLHLCSPQADQRRRALAFAEQIVDLAGPLGGFAVIGLLKGVVEPGVERSTALAWLGDGLDALGRRAAKHGVPLILEPLNRYESSWINRLDEGVDLILSRCLENVGLLADLFHMNIEETSIPGALLAAARYLGHVHFADSNRQAVGYGHTDAVEIGRVLREIGYDGYLTAEILPLPDAESAARQTVQAYRQCILSASGSR